MMGTPSVPAPGSDSRLHVRIIVGTDEFDALRGDWNAIVENQDRASVFLSHQWFDAAWQWRRETAQLFIIGVFRGERLTAVLPLVRSYGEGRRQRTLEFLTVPDTQFCDVLMGAEDRQAAALAMADALVSRRREWDVLRLAYLPEASVAAGDLAAALSLRKIRNAYAPTTRNPYVPLDAPWDAYYATRSRSLKKANNLCANRLGKAGTVEIRRFAPGAMEASTVESVIDDVTSISARSWKTQRTTNALDQPGPQAFIRRLSRLACDAGWLSVWTLSLDGKPLAMEYQLIAGGSVYALRSDFDAAYEELSPGSHLNRVLLERLCGEGLQRYFMGPGNNAYKRRWTEIDVGVGELVAFSPTARGRVAATWQLVIKPRLRSFRERRFSVRRHDS